MAKKKRWRKSKIVAVVMAIVMIVFFSIFNTSTRYGRWLYWQDMDLGDIDRFAFRVVQNHGETVRQFSDGQVPDSIKNVISEFRVNGQSIEEFASSHQSTALIIIQNNEVLLEEYFQGSHRAKLQSSVSCTKSVISLMVGIAIEEGLIQSVDDSITDYVDGLPEPFAAVTIRHLLTMTAGFSDSNAELFGAIPAPWSDRVCGYYDPNLRGLAKNFTLANSPGARFEYHDYSPILIGMLLENVTGQNLSSYFEEKIWKPGGMEFPARWSLDSRRHQFELPAVGLHATAIDFARLGAILIDDSQTIVSTSWLQQSKLDENAGSLLAKKYAPVAERVADNGAEDLAEHIRGIRYGFYWWGIQREGRYDFYANGRFGQFIYICPEAKLVIVRHGTGHGGLNDWYFGHYFFQLASAVIAAKQKESSDDLKFLRATPTVSPARRWT